jgi:hypothetical protein
MTAKVQPGQSGGYGIRALTKRILVVLTVWAMGLAGVLASVVFPSSASAAPTTAGAYESVAPARVLNTLTGVGALKGAVAAKGTVHLKVAGVAPVPAGVSAVVLNVAVVSPASAGFITVHGGGTARPPTSNLNFVKGQTVSNMVIAAVATNGVVDLYNGSTGTVQLVADVSGYYLSGTPTDAGAYRSVTPSRVLNTLAGVGALKGAVAANGTVHLKVAGVGSVPAGVSAVVLNVAVVSPASAGFITVHRGGTARPPTSNLNFVKGQTVSNLVVAPVATNGVVDLYNGSTGTVQLVADVSGYYLPGEPGDAGAYSSVTPSRILNTLAGVGAPKVAVPAGGTLNLQVAGMGGIPATGVSTVVLNVAVVSPASAGFITVHGGLTARPGTSNLNFVKDQTVSNLVSVKVGANGKVTLFNGSTGTVQLVADVSGYYLATGRVTDLLVKPGSSNLNMIALYWTNPTDADFTGVMIRRAVGAKAPATPTGGTLVRDLINDPVAYVADTGLAAGTQYSYAFFAHDGANNYAAAANVTFTTDVGGAPTAELSISRGGVAAIKLTKGVSFDFDASSSSAVTGKTLSTATLNYGDGTTVEPFTGDPSSWSLSHSYVTTGPKIVTLKVTDSAGVIATKAVTVNVLDVPTATITATGDANVDEPFRVTLGSTTPEGTVITSYDLNVIGPDGTETPYGAAGAVPPTKDLTFPSHGDYTVEFSVSTDAGGSSVMQSVTVKVNGPATAVLSITDSSAGETTTSTVDEELLFDASGSYVGAAGATPAKVELAYGDGTVKVFTGDQANWFEFHSYSTPGDKTVTLTVTPSVGVPVTKTVTVTVSAVPAAPTATITGPTGPVRVGDEVTFTLGSTTPAGTEITTWAVGDDGPGNWASDIGTPDPTVTHIFTADDFIADDFGVDGECTVVFSFANDAGDSVQASMKVTRAP